MKFKAILAIFILFLAFGCERRNDDVSIPVSDSEAIKNKSLSVVFIAGFDEDDNTYYTNAKKHFEQQGLKIVEDLHSLDEIIDWLLTNSSKTYDEIHIVSHSNAWRGLSLRSTKNGERIHAKSLNALLEKGTLPKLEKRITEESKIIFHSCGLGENTELLQLLKKVFSSEVEAIVYATPSFNVFGGKYASHYLAKPYYVFHPTAQSKGPLALSNELQISYPLESINWLSALKTREEISVGAPYSYRFNIPVELDITFEDSASIPFLKDAESIMDWISERDDLATTIYDLGIPLEKFRWNSRIAGDTLEIRGKTTVQCVLQPIMNPQDPTEYQPVDSNIVGLYTKL